MKGSCCAPAASAAVSHPSGSSCSRPAAAPLSARRRKFQAGAGPTGLQQWPKVAVRTTPAPNSWAPKLPTYTRDPSGADRATASGSDSDVMMRVRQRRAACRRKSCAGR